MYEMKMASKSLNLEKRMENISTGAVSIRKEEGRRRKIYTNVMN